jgi:membrane-associated phospholipid phosphatase
MGKQNNKRIIAFSIVFYVIAIALMVLGTVKDLQIDFALFNPENTFSVLCEQFSQFVYWGMWGIAFTFLFLCRHSLNDSLEIIGKLIPAIKPVKDTSTKLYKVLNTILNIITAVAFYALSVIGWKKLVENVLKNILKDLGKDDMSQVFYFVFCAILSAVVILLCSKIDKQKLKKLEALALAGILLGICYKIVEECKDITSRVRFREMVAYSNGFFNKKGLTDAKNSPLTREMVSGTDFSHFTAWYKKGDDMGVYNHSDSFPSGHTTYCCSLLLSYPLCLAFEKLKKFAPFMFVFSVAYVILIGFTRMVVGAHYLTDVAGAGIIGYTLFLIVYKIYTVFTKKGIIG